MNGIRKYSVTPIDLLICIYKMKEGMTAITQELVDGKFVYHRIVATHPEICSVSSVVLLSKEETE